jgi:hypothetical protein
MIYILLAWLAIELICIILMPIKMRTPLPGESILDQIRNRNKPDPF